MEGHYHCLQVGRAHKEEPGPALLTLSHSHPNEAQTLVLRLWALLPCVHASFFH